MLRAGARTQHAETDGGCRRQRPTRAAEPDEGRRWPTEAADGECEGGADGESVGHGEAIAEIQAMLRQPSHGSEGRGTPSEEADGGAGHRRRGCADSWSGSELDGSPSYAAATNADDGFAVELADGRAGRRRRLPSEEADGGMAVDVRCSGRTASSRSALRTRDDADCIDGHGRAMDGCAHDELDLSAASARGQPSDKADGDVHCSKLVSRYGYGHGSPDGGAVAQSSGRTTRSIHTHKILTDKGADMTLLCQHDFARYASRREEVRTCMRACALVRAAYVLIARGSACLY